MLSDWDIEYYRDEIRRIRGLPLEQQVSSLLDLLGTLIIDLKKKEES